MGSKFFLVLLVLGSSLSLADLPPGVPAVNVFSSENDIPPAVSGCPESSRAPIVAGVSREVPGTCGQGAQRQSYLAALDTAIHGSAMLSGPVCAPSPLPQTVKNIPQSSVAQISNGPQSIFDGARVCRDPSNSDASGGGSSSKACCNLGYMEGLRQLRSSLDSMSADTSACSHLSMCSVWYNKGKEFGRDTCTYGVQRNLATGAATGFSCRAVDEALFADPSSGGQSRSRTIANSLTDITHASYPGCFEAGYMEELRSCYINLEKNEGAVPRGPGWQGLMEVTGHMLWGPWDPHVAKVESPVASDQRIGATQRTATQSGSTSSASGALQ